VANGKSLGRVQVAMEAIRERVTIAPGGRLPSIRGLAEQLKISKSTIVEAYDRLVAEGAVEARRGSGFFAAMRVRPFKLKDSGLQLDRAIDPLWIMRQALASNAALQPGSGWLPDDWLAGDMLRRVLRGISRDERANLTAYGTLQGFLPLLNS
jgi:DNA-binding transcriptional MocR family regulator